MANRQGKPRVVVLLRRLVRLNRLVQRCSDEIEHEFQGLPMTGPTGSLGNLLGSPADPSRLFRVPITNAPAKTVTWGGQTCKLGPTIQFRLMEQLARRPGMYFTYDHLSSLVWEGRCPSDDAIRSMARHLKRRLRRAGMTSLAKAIRSIRRNYVLLLDGS